MSFKSLVCAGMLSGLLVAPVAAQPTLIVDLVRTAGGLPVLSAAGNWQWAIDVQGAAFESSLAVEIGIQMDTLTSLTPGDLAIWDTSNPGEDVTGLVGAFDYTGADADGFQSIGNEAYISVGSTVISDFTNPIHLATIEAGPPSTSGSLSTTIDIIGAWATATTLGSSAIVVQEISAGNQMTTTTSLSETKTATPGDTDLDGDVDGGDLATIGQNWDPLGGNPGNTWSNGNFNVNDGNSVDGGDLAALGQNWDPLGANTDPPGSGSGVVPEPASALLVLLGALLAGVARVRR